ncbi:hypothetical protein GALMADRAFT_213876 [Galerina marginata CBS 339.88]|uniref:Uncharacterized protein n=1 Tax=Galerina marginata (strain CBS 339.88) TaxID=685588 RepID=A0A067SXV7_GALM3|nr:hypothetical protein GALMADRAFT_213876 [Galerina marginata CBS 339.88]
MFGGDKDRLYLTLNHRYNLPGFHWAFVLAGKDEGSGKSPEKKETRWHVVNPNSTATHRAHWKFEQDKVNQYNSASLCARIVLRKIDPARRQKVISYLKHVLETQVRIWQGDANFSCVSWALEAVAVLQRLKIIQLTVPLGDFENIVTRFGDESLNRIATGRLNIAQLGASAIPVLELLDKNAVS